MALLNYTTSIEAAKTVGEIHRILAKHGAKAILTSYTDGGQIEALSFQILTPSGEIGIRLPIDPDAVLKVLTNQNRMGKVPNRYVNRAQAVRVAWRIVKDWVEAQLALLETEMVRIEQIFLPYIITNDGRVLFERMAEQKFLLGEGK